MWPLAGGLLGFLLFFVLLVYGLLATTDHLLDKAIDLLGVSIATGIAAFVGGWAAFRAERRTQDINRRNSRISAGNKAIFTIDTVYTIFKNLREHYIDANGVRGNPNRAIEMDSPQAGMLSDIKFNFDELSYFLDHPEDICSGALKGLAMFEWNYQVLVQTVEYRAEAMEELRLELQAKPVSNLPPESVEIVNPAAYQKLKATTDQFVKSVDEGLKDAEEIYLTFQKALRCQFPGQRFLQIDSFGKGD
jgi:hypothetical protein